MEKERKEEEKKNKEEGRREEEEKSRFGTIVWNLNVWKSLFV